MMVRVNPQFMQSDPTPMPHRVMLIDGSEADLLYAEIMLQRCGEAWEISRFESARAALAALHDDTAADLILLDINMPGLDGFGFLEAYERLPRRSRTPVVMLTSSPDPADRARALRHRCVKDYLTKPLDRDAAASLAQLLVPG